MALRLGIAILFVVLSGAALSASPPDVILYSGKIVTVDKQFAIHEAIALQGDKIIGVGTDEQIKRLAGPETKKINLNGKTVLPGLIDSHVHAPGAAVYEFDHEIPVMESVADVLAYVESRAKVVPVGDWITLNQVFITRLKDQRFPTRKELDEVAPNHPVYFRTGPDAALNSMALKLNGIDRDFKVPAGETGKVERDPETGEPTGILRSSAQFVKVKSSERAPTAEDRRRQLKKLFADYNSVGITSVSDRAGSAGGLESYVDLHDSGELTCRVYVYYSVSYNADLSEIEKQVKKIVSHEKHQYNPNVWVRGVKVFLDGGMLTGSAYMLKPWGPSASYGISDPEYRGVRNIDPDKLYAICKLVLDNNLQMTAHAVGDGAVEALVNTYAAIHEDGSSVKGKRPCVTHCNFMTPQAIEKMAELGIVADLQPAWLWLDGAKLTAQFGQERMTWFQPYRTLFEKGVIVGGGSDHMQKIGSFRSVNPYNPFLGMWIAMTRQPRGTQVPLFPEQSLSREQVIRLYTSNNAWLTFEEDKKGSLEVGKLADLIVLDTDLLTCPLDQVKEIQVEQTWLGGKQVYQKP